MRKESDSKLGEKYLKKKGRRLICFGINRIRHNMNLVEWCNCNQGFVEAIMCLSSIIIGVVAVVVSLKTAFLPYKKEVLFNPFFYRDESGKIGCIIHVANVGNRIVVIDVIDLKCHNMILGTVYGNDKCGYVAIEPSQIREYKGCLDISEDEWCGDKTKVLIEAVDIEGKKYSTYVDRAFG